MTGHNLYAGGQPVHELLLANIRSLVDTMLDRLVAEIPLYRQLPREELDGDIRRITDQTLRTFIASIRDRSIPSDAALEPMRESAIRRAEEGVPLEALLAAYHLGAGVCTDFVAARFRPDELADSIELSRLLLDYLQRVTAAVSASYFEERQTMVGDEQASRQSLLATLLDGGPAYDVARQSGIRLPERYLVLGFNFRAPSDQTEPGVDTDIVTRRRLRRLRTELDRHPGGPVMSTLSADGGLALLPAAGSDAELESVRAAMTRAGGTEVTVTVTSSEPAGVPAAAVLVRELLEVVRSFRLPPGVYTLDDLTLEYQLTRPSPARDRLAALLDPLADKPDLVETLRCYLDCGRNRRDAAGRLHVHPNTVDYRLRQIGRLTGLDSSRPDHLPRLLAALAAWDAAAGDL